MPRFKSGSWGTKVWLSARDTSDWKSRVRWPCSAIAGRPLFAEFDASGDLVDVSADVPGDEFNAITSDFIRARFGPEHPAIRS